jgi:alpha-tubulin suppressor-like RCC1 family protein
VLSNGTVRCWGYNALALLFTDQLDEPAAAGSFVTTPTEVPDLADALEVEGGDASSCVLTSAQSLKCWGWNGAGQLGTQDFMDYTTPAEVTFGAAVVDMAVGLAHTCVTLANGDLLCWGLNENGQLGNGVIDMPAFVPEHQLVALGVPASKVSAGFGNTCALTTAAEAACWGDNDDGELANGDTMDSGSPVGVLGEGATDLAVGVGHVCGLEQGALACWGRNTYGQLGLGVAGGDVLTETEVTGVSPKKMSLGASHTCVIDANDALLCWGRNEEGQIGNGLSGLGAVELTHFAVPIDTVVDVALGHLHTCALTTAGQVLCWGHNNHGQLGTGDTTALSEPTPVVW